MSSRRAVVAVLLSAALLPACQTATVTARNTVNPILLGPVRVLGEPKGAPDVPVDNIGSVVSVSTDSMSSTSGADGSSSSHAEKSAGTQPDWDVLVATSGDARRYVTVSRLSCSGYAFLILVGAMADATCRLEGEVYQPLDDSTE